MSKTFNVAGFSRESRDLIRRLEDAGVAFRLSSKNHAIGVAPLGIGTISIPRKLNEANRGKQNANAATEKMLRNIAAINAKVQPAMPTVQSLGKAADVLLATEGSEIGDKIIMRGIEKKVAAVTEKVSGEVPAAEIVKTEPWLAHKASSKDGGTYYKSQTTTQRTWSDGTVDYVCAYCGGYNNENPRAVASHYARSKSHPDLGQGKDKNEVPGSDYFEPLTHHPSKSRVEAILAILAKHPGANHDLPLNELVELILSADMERDPLFERNGDVPAPGSDAEIVARIRTLVGVTPREAELQGQVDDLTTRLAEATDEVLRLKEERATLRDLLA